MNYLQFAARLVNSGEPEVNMAEPIRILVAAGADPDQGLADALTLSPFSTQERLEDLVGQYTGGQGFDLVFDTVGGANLPRAFAAARLAGTVVTTIGLTSVDLSPMHAKALSLKVVYVLTPLLYGVGRQQHGKILTHIAALVDGHAVTPPLNEKHFGLEETAQAFDYAQFGKTPGKVIIQIT